MKTPTLLIVLILLIPALFQRLAADWPKTPSLPLESEDPESHFARGKLLRLSECTLTELELIPGLPASSIDQLLLNRYRLIEGEIALEDVPTFGPTRAKLVRQYVVVN